MRKFFDDSILLKDLFVGTNRELDEYLNKNEYIYVYKSDGTKPDQLLHCYFKYTDDHIATFNLVCQYN